MTSNEQRGLDALTRPIIGIENRTAQEVFDIMCDRIRLAAIATPLTREPVAWRCKDFADGWILDHNERSAREYERLTGCVVQALYTATPEKQP